MPPPASPSNSTLACRCRPQQSLRAARHQSAVRPVYPLSDQCHRTRLGARVLPWANAAPVRKLLAWLAREGAEGSKRQGQFLSDPRQFVRVVAALAHELWLRLRRAGVAAADASAKVTSEKKESAAQKPRVLSGAGRVGQRLMEAPVR